MSRDAAAEWVTFSTAHGEARRGYLARPSSERCLPPVLVCMELFGVTDHVRDLTRRIAALGYVALAPDFYHRPAGEPDLPHTAEGRAVGFERLRGLTREGAVADVDAALGYLRARDDVAGARAGAVGFSLGGHIACVAAARCDLAASAVFYAGWLTSTEIGLGQPTPTVTLFPEIARRRGRIVFFFGGRDHVIDEAARSEIATAARRAGVDHEMVVYPEAPHGFFCDQRDTFDPQSRDDAWQRVQGLLRSLSAG
jgi:carboxymethylenebutenolidase